MSDPRKVRAIITRTVTEEVVLYLERDGSLREIDEVLECIDYENCEIEKIFSVIESY